MEQEEILGKKDEEEAIMIIKLKEQAKEELQEWYKSDILSHN